jgi:hypothetical protein
MGSWLRANLSSVLSVLAGIGGSLVALYITTSSSVRLEPVNLRVEQVASVEVAREVASLRAEVKAVQDSIQNARDLPKDTKLAIQLQQIQNALADVQTRQSKLEQAILTNPAKALEVPLLQRDLENLKTAQQANILAVKEGVDRVYDLNKWLLGAMAVSIVTLAIGTFLKSKEAGGEKK